MEPTYEQVRAALAAFHEVESELDVQWTAHKPIQGEATPKVFAYRMAKAVLAGPPLRQDVKLTGHRDGRTYDPNLDFERLNRQMKGVWEVIRTGNWYTLPYLSERTGFPPASVSARLRDFRKPKFGSQTIERQRIAGGLWAYRLVRKVS